MLKFCVVRLIYYQPVLLPFTRTIVVVLAFLCLVNPAKAFDFFGLFGSKDTPPAVSAQSLPYALSFSCPECADSIVQALQDASSLYKLRQEPPTDGESLARRVVQDLPRLLDALWGAGYYNANIQALIANVPVTIDGKGSGQAAVVAEGQRNQTVVPVRIVVRPGLRFTLRDVAIFDAASHLPLEAALLPRHLDALSRGAPASSSEILAAQTRIIDFLRSQSRPLAKVIMLRPVIDHPGNVMDIALTIDPGPRAGIGTVTVSGAQNIDHAVLKSFIYLVRGEDYSPKRLADAKKSLTQVKAVGSVRIKDGEALDKEGNLPILVEVTERKPHAIGGSLQYSTIDGPALATYWENRNLFGGGEWLRLDAAGGYTVQKGQKWNSIDNLTSRFSVNFLKPALGGTTNDLVVDAIAAREKTDYYSTHYVDLTAGIRHRFSENFWIQAAGEFEKGQSTDILGKLNYTLAGLPLSINYDTTDSPLDPTKGVKMSGTLAQYARGLGSSINLLQSKAQVSSYVALDEDARYILAGRVGFGSLMEAGLSKIPDDRRFFAGGAGSVRGYAYRSLSPETPGGTPIGGRSLLEASLEARIKLTDTIGIVPFFDMGRAFAASYPDFKQPMFYAAGLGLRYYTAIGPIRLDVATPLSHGTGAHPVAFYIGIGQSF